MGAALAPLSEAALVVWAKSTKGDWGWLPLWQHMDDSAAVAERLWDEWLPSSAQRVIASALPGGKADGRRLARWLAGVHDIGKATPAFAFQVRYLANRMREHGLAMPDAIPYQERKFALHAAAGQLLLEAWLSEIHGWDVQQARQFAVVVGGHHGIPPTCQSLEQAKARPALLGRASGSASQWRSTHRELMDWSAVRFGVADRLPEWRNIRLPQPAQVLLTGLVIVSDWIASNDELFPYDPVTLGAPSRIDAAWEGLDLPIPWQARVPAETVDELLATRFALPANAVARPVQFKAVDLARSMPTPGLLIIEAPMGEGKTEAALAAAEVLAARSGAGGCFIALPTRATSDAMFQRIMYWLGQVPDADPDRGALAVALAHGKARFNNDYRDLMHRGRVVGVEQDEESSGGTGKLSPRELAVHHWLSGRKKSMLSSFVVGTIDQLLFASLKSRHLALRHLGLAGKIVIIDEAHAYDVYMSQYLDRTLEWLAAYGVPTIVLSATLPARRRRELFLAYDRGRNPRASSAPQRRSWRRADSAPATQQHDPLEGDIGYPALISSGSDGTPRVEIAATSGRETTVMMERVEDDLPALSALLRQELVGGGCALVVCNTVRRVQEAAAELRRAFGPFGVEVSVAHSRFLAPDRAQKDQWLRDRFGPPEHCARIGVRRPTSHVVVASQVAEQSLDVDFDLLVSDLAPVDLLLQRMGRLHRHLRGKDQRDRPARLRQAKCFLRGVDWNALPPQPAAGSVRVYRLHSLLRSLAVLIERLDQGVPVRLPDDIAPLVQTAYADTPIGPSAWREAMQQADETHRRREAERRKAADTFRLGQVGPNGEAIINWLDTHVGDTDDDRIGRAQVRDTGAEGVETLVLVRRSDGLLITPPWLERGGGLEVPTEHVPEPHVARTVATCAITLPLQLSTDDAIAELERRHDYPAWWYSPWLAEQLIMVLDQHGDTDLAGYHVHYDHRDGLRIDRCK